MNRRREGMVKEGTDGWIDGVVVWPKLQYTVSHDMVIT